jgi:hypothetical protein
MQENNLNIAVSRFFLIVFQVAVFALFKKTVRSGKGNR